MRFNSQSFRITEPGKFGVAALGAAALGLVLSVVGYIVDPPRFFHAYLTAFVFWTSLGLGGLFFTMLHHLVGAKWSVVVRRLSECVMITLPFMGLMFVPALLGIHSLYEWSHPEVVGQDQLLAQKAGYLNTPFFIIRTIVFFAIWSFVALRLYRLSLQQDQGNNEDIQVNMRRTSAWGMLLYAVTITYAGYDWLMSLDPRWYSTIFGVYFFAGSLLSGIALLTLLSLLLRRQNVLEGIITVEHDHDFGKLLFAFVIFWTYIGFSQYFLIWYGNVPEETIWYLKRWEGSWRTVSLLIFFGHFVAPFVALLFRFTKRNRGALYVLTCWLLLMHWVDMYWLVYPSLLPKGASFTWIEPATLLLVGGVFLWAFWMRLVRNPLVPVADPKLAASIDHVNTY